MDKDHVGRSIDTYTLGNFIKDILKREDIELIHCSTKQMVADYYIKPLHGSLFKNMRDILMVLISFPDEERDKLGNKVSPEELRKGKNSKKIKSIVKS